MRAYQKVKIISRRISIVAIFISAGTRQSWRRSNGVENSALIPGNSPVFLVSSTIRQAVFSCLHVQGWSTGSSTWMFQGGRDGTTSPFTSLSRRPARADEVAPKHVDAMLRKHNRGNQLGQLTLNHLVNDPRAASLVRGSKKRIRIGSHPTRHTRVLHSSSPVARYHP